MSITYQSPIYSRDDDKKQVHVYVGFTNEDWREVAVKRVLTQFTKPVKREVSTQVHLSRSDNYRHNIVDYMVMF